MPIHSRTAIFLRVLLLPLVLVAGTVVGLGSYYEANDDASLGWLFAGVLSLKPVVSVPLYFHGYGHLLAAAYAAAPGVPWFGLLLGLGLLAATGLAFAVLDKLLRPHLRPGVVALVLVGFFGVAWLEHWLWFSYVRGALLLAALAVLFAAQRPGRWGALGVGLAGLLAAWLMRPSLGVLGLVAALPGAVWLAGEWRRAVPVLACGAVLLALATAVAAAWQTSAQAHTQVRDRYFARILDFDQLRPRPRTPADSLGTAALDLWLMGDATVVNEGLCQRAYVFDTADFVGRELPAKLRLRATLVVRDYFPVLLALAATAVVVARRGGRGRWFFWLAQLGFAGGLALFAGLYKLPPRLALPLLDVWLLTNLAFLLKSADYVPSRELGSESVAGRSVTPPMRRVGAGLALAVGLLYGFKTWHRHQVLNQEQHRNENALRYIRQQGDSRVRILAGTNDFLKSLSPFRVYSPGSGPVLLLSGWPSHDDSQARLRYALTGTTDQTECLRRLARPPAFGQLPPALWVLTPETAHWLSRRFRFDGPRLLLAPEHVAPSDGSVSRVWVYHVQPWPEH
ncbi:hypothetical protein ACVWYF_000377 [Hymenobacter sp. UYAg731]